MQRCLSEIVTSVRDANARFHSNIKQVLNVRVSLQSLGLKSSVYIVPRSDVIAAPSSLRLTATGAYAADRPSNHR